MVWRYTPRQIQSHLFIAAKDRKSDAAEKLSIGTMAARSPIKEVRKQLRAWKRE